MRISISLEMSLGVVPLDTSAWKPEIAPQAMVMKTNGNNFPANTGPLPSMNCVMAGIFISGCRNRIAMASKKMVPSFMNVDR